MGLTDKVKGFLKMSGHYSDSAVYLAEHGYDDKYLEMLAQETGSAKNAKEKTQGTALAAQAHLFRGEFGRSLELFEAVEINKLPDHMDSVFVNNYILLVFLMGKNERAAKLYEEHNRIALAENTLVMRRSIGINEFVNKRFENAVTVFLKLLSEPDPRVTLMADICLVKAMLALDMNDRAREIADMGFGRYTAMGDITAEVNKLRLKINGARSNKNTSGKKRRK